jgi:hypothetical protein
MTIAFAERQDGTTRTEDLLPEVRERMRRGVRINRDLHGRFGRGLAVEWEHRQAETNYRPAENAGCQWCQPRMPRTALVNLMVVICVTHIAQAGNVVVNRGAIRPCQPVVIQHALYVVD